MKKINYVYAAAHEMTKLQQNELEGLNSLDLPEEIQKEMANNTKGQNLVSLALKFLVWCKENSCYDIIQPAGSPAFQAALQSVLPKEFEVYYSYSKRVSMDITQPDGSVKKISQFNHEGFYNIYGNKLSTILAYKYPLEKKKEIENIIKKFSL